MLLAGRLRVPATTEALIFGLEGVLLDTLVRDGGRRAQDAVLDILADAEHRSFSIGVVADSPVDTVVALLGEAGLRDWVDVIIGQAADPDAYREVARRLGVAPSNCVVIDNSRAAAEAATRAGCYTIGVATGPDSFDTLVDSPFTSDCVPDFTVRARLAALGFRARLPDDDPYLPWRQDPSLPVPSERYSWPTGDTCPYPLPQSVAAELSGFVAAAADRTYPNADDLGSALGAYCGVAEEQIMVTNGARQGIELVLRAVLRPGRKMAVARPEYPVYGRVARACGASILGVPYEVGLRFPYRGFAAAAALADLIVLINPNNPTGTPVERDFIERILRAHPSTPVVVDEAYYEFTEKSVVDLTLRHDNLIVVRTFGKAFAMPGLRLGYLVGDPRVLNEIGAEPDLLGVNELAVVAGCAHLSDIDASRVHWIEAMRVVKPLLVGGLRELGVRVMPGAANFVIIAPPGGRLPADRIRQAGVLLQPFRGWGQEGRFRMAVGTYGEVVDGLAVVRKCLSANGSK